MVTKFTDGSWNPSGCQSMPYALAVVIRSQRGYSAVGMRERRTDFVKIEIDDFVGDRSDG